ncbi:hypothetical protein KKG48_02580, partial [Patescibacteria group bacterium]|nr:hypothetical protein [Patescibacteria group bacterium]
RFFEPNNFFVIRNGLWISLNFRNYILSVAEKILPIQLPSHIPGFDLPKRINDAEIRAKLGDNHLFEDASEFCSCLAGMISRQANGEEGDLLNNGSSNIFYVCGKEGEVFAVFASWAVDDRRWDVSALRLGGLSWLAGRRAFSRNSILGK